MNDEDQTIEAMLREAAERMAVVVMPVIPNRYHPGNEHACSCGKKYRTELAAEFCLVRGHRALPNSGGGR